MKIKSIVVSLLLDLLFFPAYGIQMNYVHTTFEGETYIDKSCVDKVIKIENENPETLYIYDTYYDLNAPVCSIRTTPNTWEEHYVIERSFPVSGRSNFLQTKKIGMATLFKDRLDGVVGIAICDQSGPNHLFRPGNGERLDVTRMPVIYINKVQMANVRADGTFINDFNSVIECTDLDRLLICAEYQKNDNKISSGFTLKVVSKNGKIIKTINGMESLDNAFASENGKHKLTSIIWFTKKEKKKIKKGDRLEIHADNGKLCAVDIPIRGKILYKPTLVVRVRTSGDEMHSVPFNPGNSIYGEPMMTKQFTFMCGRHQYKVLEWREIEL